MNGQRRVADLLGLLTRHLRAQRRIILHFHQDGGCDFGHQIAGLLLFLTKKRIEKSGCSNFVAEFAMFEEDMHRFPQRVVQDLDHFLMNERILSEGLDRIGAFHAGQSEGQRISGVGKLEGRANLLVPAFGGPNPITISSG